MDGLRALAFGLVCIAAVLFILSWFGIDYCGTCGGWGYHGDCFPGSHEVAGTCYPD
jgi:hypothetical protein